jgi:hypothetical protein
MVIKHPIALARGCFITTAFQLCFRICYYEGPGKSGGTEIEWELT